MAAILDETKQDTNPLRSNLINPVVQAGRDVAGVISGIGRNIESVSSGENIDKAGNAGGRLGARVRNYAGAAFNNTVDALRPIADAGKGIVGNTVGFVSELAGNPDIGNVSPVKGAVAADGFAGQGSPATQAAAKTPSTTTPLTSTPPKPAGIVTNIWQQASMSSEPMKNMGGSPGNAIFASGQGQNEANSMFQWNVRDGDNIRSVMLPQGVNPKDLTPQQLEAFSPQVEQLADTGKEVTVSRGFRDFKGGKEIKDGMTGERKQQQEINNAISSLGQAKDKGINQTAAAGVISQITKSSSDLAATKMATDADKAKARMEAAKAIATGDTKTGSFKFTNRDMLGNQKGVEIPYRTDGPGHIEFNIPGMPSIITQNGKVVLPKDVKPDSVEGKKIQMFADTLFAGMLEQLQVKE